MTKKRKKTELGRTLAKIRIDFDETGSDMAKKLGISSSQMFNIEVGLAQVGYEFIGKLKKVYGVDLGEMMRRGGFVSKITIDLDELSQDDKETVLKIWSRKWDADPLKPTDTVYLEKLTITPPADDPVEQPTASLAEAEAVKPKKPGDTPEDRKARGRPKTVRAGDGIGFLDDKGTDDLDGIEEIDCI